MMNIGAVPQRISARPLVGEISNMVEPNTLHRVRPPTPSLCSLCLHRAHHYDVIANFKQFPLLRKLNITELAALRPAGDHLVAELRKEKDRRVLPPLKSRSQKDLELHGERSCSSCGGRVDDGKSGRNGGCNRSGSNGHGAHCHDSSHSNCRRTRESRNHGHGHNHSHNHGHNHSHNHSHNRHGRGNSTGNSRLRKSSHQLETQSYLSRAEAEKSSRMKKTSDERPPFRPSNARQAKEGIVWPGSASTGIGTPYDSARQAENERWRKSKSKFVGGDFRSAVGSIPAREKIERRSFLASGRFEEDIINESEMRRTKARENMEAERWRARVEAKRLTKLKELREENRRAMYQ